MCTDEDNKWPYQWLYLKIGNCAITSQISFHVVQLSKIDSSRRAKLLLEHGSVSNLRETREELMGIPNTTIAVLMI